MSELRYRMFTEKKLSEDRSSSTLDASILHLRRSLIFFLNYFTSFIKNKNIISKKTFSLHETAYILFTLNNFFLMT